MTTRIKTLLVDDQAPFREAMLQLLGLDGRVHVVAEAADGEEALRLTAEHQPHVVLMDLRMPVMDGVEATRRIRAAHPEVRVLMLTIFDQEENVFESLRAGACGYVLKNTPVDQLVEAIRTVAKGQTYLHPSVATHVVAEFNRLSQPSPLSSEEKRIASQLSQREEEILRHLVRGMSNKEIATALCLTEGTVKNYMSRILDKLQVPDRTSAALMARTLGLA